MAAKLWVESSNIVEDRGLLYLESFLDVLCTTVDISPGDRCGEGGRGGMGWREGERRECDEEEYKYKIDKK